MCSDVRVHLRVTATDVFHGLWAAPIAWLMASSVAAAQENPNPAGSSYLSSRDPRDRDNTGGAASHCPPCSCGAAAPTSAAAPTAAAAPETASNAVPGAVELDKIPSNVQTVGASAFDGTKAPDLLQPLDRALPGVSLSSQKRLSLDFNYRGYRPRRDRHAPGARRLSERGTHQRGLRRRRQLGLDPAEGHQPANARSQQSGYGLNATGGALAFEMKNGTPIMLLRANLAADHTDAPVLRCKPAAKTEICPAT